MIFKYEKDDRKKTIVEIELADEDLAQIVAWFAESFSGPIKLKEELRAHLMIGLREMGYRDVRYGKITTKARHCTTCDTVSVTFERGDGRELCGNCGGEHGRDRSK